MIPNTLNVSVKTPVFPFKIDYRSSERGEADLAVPRLKIVKCKYNIRKVDSKLYIDDKEFDISLKNVLEFCQILKNNGVTVSFLDNRVGWDLPAVCITNFNNQPIYEATVSYLPYNIELINTIKSKALVPLVYTEITLIDTYINRNKTRFEVKDSLLTHIEGFRTEAKLIYKVRAEDFYIKINQDMFSTSNKELVCKHMERK